MLKFNETTGLLLSIKNNSDDIRDILNNEYNDKTSIVKELKKNNNKKLEKHLIKQDKITTLQVKSQKEYNQKLDKNLQKLNEIQKKKQALKLDEKGKTRDEKGRFIAKNKTASEKAKENKKTNKEDKEKIEVKIPVEEIGEAVGDAYYQSYHELKTFFTPFIDFSKNIFQKLKAPFVNKDKKEIKSASEKATKDKHQTNKDEEILKTNKKELEVDKKILKELKHHRPKSEKSVFSLDGIKGILKSILGALAPLALIYGVLKDKLKNMLPKRNYNKTPKNKSKTPNKTKNNTKRPQQNKKNRRILTKEDKRTPKQREIPKSRKRVKIPNKVSQKAGTKIGTKVAGKVASKFIPFLGWGLTAYDTYNIGKDMYNGASFSDSFKKNFLGIEPEQKKHLSKKELIKINETKEALKKSKSTLKIEENKTEYKVPTTNNKNWRDYDPTPQKKEKKNEKKGTIKKDKIYSENVSNNPMLKAQLDTEIELLKQNIITNTLLSQLIEKSGGKTINYSPNRESFKEW